LTLFVGKYPVLINKISFSFESSLYAIIFNGLSIILICHAYFQINNGLMVMSNKNALNELLNEPEMVYLNRRQLTNYV